jgi:hypothetical protein
MMSEIKQQFAIFWKSTFDVNERGRLFKSIWNDYHKKIQVFAGTFTNREQVDIEDISQEIMLKIYNNLHQYNPVYSFNTMDIYHREKSLYRLYEKEPEHT